MFACAWQGDLVKHTDMAGQVDRRAETKAVLVIRKHTLVIVVNQEKLETNSI
jgi:hypothetical protein